MRAADGAVREGWAELAALVDRSPPAGLAAATRRLLADEGVTYRPPGEHEQPWALDPLPLPLTAADVGRAGSGRRATGAAARPPPRRPLRPRLTLRTGLLPVEVVLGTPASSTAGPAPRRVPASCSSRAPTSCARREGWRVLGDRVQAPSGAGYALANRRIVSRVLASVRRDAQIRRLGPFFDAMRRGLEELAPAPTARGSCCSPPGPGRETAYEQALLASRLGFPLVLASELTVREGRVWQRTMGGAGRLEPVDVILRRVDAAWCDPLDLRQDSHLGVPGLLEAARLGTVAVVNGLGSGRRGEPRAPAVPARRGPGAARRAARAGRRAHLVVRRAHRPLARARPPRRPARQADRPRRRARHRRRGRAHHGRTRRAGRPHRGRAARLGRAGAAAAEHRAGGRRRRLPGRVPAGAAHVRRRRGRRPSGCSRAGSPRRGRGATTVAKDVWVSGASRVRADAATAGRRAPRPRCRRAWPPTCSGWAATPSGPRARRGCCAPSPTASPTSARSPEPAGGRGPRRAAAGGHRRHHHAGRHPVARLDHRPRPPRLARLRGAPPDRSGAGRAGAAVHRHLAGAGTAGVRARRGDPGRATSPATSPGPSRGCSKACWRWRGSPPRATSARRAGTSSTRAERLERAQHVAALVAATLCGPGSPAADGAAAGVGARSPPRASITYRRRHRAGLQTARRWSCSSPTRRTRARSGYQARPRCAQDVAHVPRAGRRRRCAAPRGRRRRSRPRLRPRRPRRDRRRTAPACELPAHAARDLGAATSPAFADVLEGARFAPSAPPPLRPLGPRRGDRAVAREPHLPDHPPHRRTATTTPSATSFGRAAPPAARHGPARRACDAARQRSRPQPAERRERVDWFGNRATYLADPRAAHRRLSVLATFIVDDRRAAGRPRRRRRGRRRATGCARAPTEALRLDARMYTLPSPRAARARRRRTRTREPSFTPGRPSRRRPSTSDAPHPHRLQLRQRLATTSRRTVRRGAGPAARRLPGLRAPRVACLRALGLAARYVSGYLETTPPPGRPRLVGADASHAWVVGVHRRGLARPRPHQRPARRRLLRRAGARARLRRRAPVEGRDLRRSTGSVMDVAVDMIRVDRG